MGMHKREKAAWDTWKRLNSLPVCVFPIPTSVALLAQWLFSGPGIHRLQDQIPQSSEIFFLSLMHARFTQASFFIHFN